MYDLILKNGTLINEGKIFESDIAIKGDRIEKIASSIDAESKSTVDLKGKYVFQDSLMIKFILENLV